MKCGNYCTIIPEPSWQYCPVCGQKLLPEEELLLPDSLKRITCPKCKGTTFNAVYAQDRLKDGKWAILQCINPVCSKDKINDITIMPIATSDGAYLDIEYHTP